jgi:ketopantoate reductase
MMWPLQYPEVADDKMDSLLRAWSTMSRAIASRSVEAGRSLETGAQIGSILEMARLTDTAAPAIEALYALVKLLNKVMLLEGGG